jgi:hypothetical protein
MKITVIDYMPLECVVKITADRASGAGKLTATLMQMIPPKWRRHDAETRAWYVLPTRQYLGRWLDACRQIAGVEIVLVGDDVSARFSAPADEAADEEQKGES